MKKTTVILIASLLVLVMVASCVYFWPVKVGTFSVSDHQDDIVRYLKHIEHWEERLDFYETRPIKNGRDAKWTAFEMWFKVYGWEIFTEFPYHVFYDEKNDTWYVESSLTEGKLGGTAYLIITSEGELVAVGHGA